MLLRIACRFVDCECGIDTLTETDTNATFPIANDDHETEIETATACHDASDTASINGDLLKLPALAWRACSAVPAA